MTLRERAQEILIPEWRNGGDIGRALDRILSLVAEDRRSLEAELAATVCAAEELAAGAGLPPVVIGRVRRLDGSEEDWAIEPSKIRGLMGAFRNRVKECTPFGVSAVEARYKLDSIRAEIGRAAEDRRALVEAAKALLDECKIIRASNRPMLKPHPDTVADLDAALAAEEGEK